MAVKARRHYKCIHLSDHIHILHLAVTALTFNTAVYVHAVVKVYKVRHPVYSFPWNGLIIFKVSCKLNNFRTVLTSYAVAVHTGADRWDHSMAGFVSSRMAVSAVDAHSTGMEFM